MQESRQFIAIQFVIKCQVAFTKIELDLKKILTQEQYFKVKALVQNRILRLAILLTKMQSTLDCTVLLKEKKSQISKNDMVISLPYYKKKKSKKIKLHEENILLACNKDALLERKVARVMYQTYILQSIER